MYLATTTGDFNEYGISQIEALKHIKEAGFSYADYNFGQDYRRKDGFFGNDAKEHLSCIKKATEELGIKFIQSHAPMGDPIREWEGRYDFIEMNKKCIEACGKIGIPNIVIHTGYERGLSKEETFARNKKFYDELLPVAEKNNVYILAENFNKMCIDGLYWIDHAKDLKDFLDYMNHPYLKACWDAGHGNMIDVSQEESLKILGDYVYALHIQDNDGDDDLHYAPYFGSLSLDSLMTGLVDIGYKGYFTFEATNIPVPSYKRKKCDKSDKLIAVPLHIKKMTEKLLYEIGKHILSEYDEFEE